MSDAPRTNPDLHERVAEVINQIRPHLQGVASGDLRGHDGHHLADACLDKARHGVDVKTMRQVSQAPLAGDLRGGSQVLAHDYRNRRLAKREAGGKRSFMIDGEMKLREPDGTTDAEALAAGYVSVTPIALDLTARGLVPGGASPAEWEWLSRLHLTRT